MDLVETTRHDWLASFPEQWRQGEHIALIGPTGSGKTGLSADLVSLRAYACVLAVKPKDDTLQSFQGFKLIRKWPPEYGQRHVILWVKPQGLSDVGKQREKLLTAMEAIYKAGGWCVDFDDVSYMASVLKLRDPLTVFLNQGRSNGVSAVASTTRPRRVPVEMFNQSRFTIAFRYGDREEIRRIAEIAGVDFRSMLYLNEQLQRHKQGKREWTDFLCIGKERVTIVRNLR